MRLFVLLGVTTALAACGGAGGSLSSAGSSAATPGGTATPTPTATATPTPSGTATPTPSATPTPTPGSGPSTAVTPPPAPATAVMFSQATAASYKAIGSAHSLKTNTEIAADGTRSYSYLYAGDAATASAGSGTISYDPRDGIFTLSLADGKANVTRNVTFQDPAHRTDYKNVRTPDPSAINLTNYNYMAVLESDGPTTFFYQRPGNRTNYVTLAGLVHFTDPDTVKYDPGTTAVTIEERGAFAFGTPTPLTQVPRTGGGRFEGDFLATMTARSFDNGNPGTVRLQWINGVSTIDVDFAKSSVALALSGTVSPAWADRMLVADSQLMIPSGTAFTAAATATIDAANGTFAGRFGSAGFGTGATAQAVDFAAISAGSSTAGASSIDGGFYGPNAVEVGGSFRIVGGVPDQRVDILGAFTGAKK